jgi:hypothetical protein
MAASVTRLPNGVSTNTPDQNLANWGLPDPTRYHTWFDDFDDYLAANWVRTATGTGTTVVNTGADGGLLLTTNSAADNDAVFYQWSENAAAGTAETFKFIAGKKLWFKSRLKVSDVTESDFVMGLQITDTTPLAVSDGVFFRKDDGDTNLNFVVTKGSTATTTVITGQLANDTFITLGFYYNGVDKISIFINDAAVSSSVITNLPDTEELTLSFGVQNGEAVAKTMSVDYILVSKER